MEDSNDEETPGHHQDRESWMNNSCLPLPIQPYLKDGETLLPEPHKALFNAQRRDIAIFSIGRHLAAPQEAVTFTREENKILKEFKEASQTPKKVDKDLAQVEK